MRKKKLKIGFVVPGLLSEKERGGIVSFLVKLRALKRIGFDCSVLSFDSGKQKENNIDFSGMEIVQGKSSRNKLLDWFLKFRSIADFSRNKDIVQFENMDLNLLGGFFSFFSKKKTVIVLNSFYYFYPKKVSLIEYKEPWFLRKHSIALQNSARHFLVKRASAFVCLSNASKQVYESLGFPKKKISIIPPAVDKIFLEKGNTFVSGRRVLFAGALDAEKGVEHLVRAMVFLDENTELWIAGSGKEEKKLKKLAVELGLKRRVKFLGWVNHNDLPKVFSECNVFVHPGVWIEPFGRIIIEAMSAGLPVVATAIGAPKETVPQKKLLCDPMNSEQLAEKILFLLDNPKIARKIGMENKKIALEKYSEEKIAMAFSRLYDLL